MILFYGAFNKQRAVSIYGTGSFDRFTSNINSKQGEDEIDASQTRL